MQASDNVHAHSLRAGIEKPVDLDLKHVLADMPRKVFKSDRQPSVLLPLKLPEVDVRSHLDRVLRLLSVGSKRFLTNKVDRSVTGLIAQQPCVGPLHTPLAVSRLHACLPVCLDACLQLLTLCA